MTEHDLPLPSDMDKQAISTGEMKMKSKKFLLFYISQIEKQNKAMRKVHELIASCKSVFPGDCQDLSQKVLSSLTYHA